MALWQAHTLLSEFGVAQRHVVVLGPGVLFREFCNTRTVAMVFKQSHILVLASQQLSVDGSARGAT
eukprot:3151009-Amphidinium_carterae.1